MNQNSQQLDVVVIGAGQAGLAAGYHLARTNLRFEILEAAPRVGDCWRRRWDSLRLFTPAQHDGLPGLPFPAAPNTFPGKEEFAAYLERYAARFGLPVRTGVRVEGVRPAGAGFAVDTPGRHRAGAQRHRGHRGQRPPPHSRTPPPDWTPASSSCTAPSTAARRTSPTATCSWWAPERPARKLPWSSRPATGCSCPAGPPRTFPTPCSATPAGPTGGSSTRS